MPTPGPLELVIILVIALLVLGPGKLPEVGSALGKSIREFRKAASDVQDVAKISLDTSAEQTQASTNPPPEGPVADKAAAEPVRSGTSLTAEPILIAK